MKVKEENEKAVLKLNIQKTKIMAFGPIITWQIGGGNNGNSDRLNFPRLQNHCMGREEGGGFRMGNTCIPVADSF